MGCEEVEIVRQSVCCGNDENHCATSHPDPRLASEEARTGVVNFPDYNL
jgi:hypothetical protein